MTNDEMIFLILGLPVSIGLAFNFICGGIVALLKKNKE